MRPKSLLLAVLAVGVAFAIEHTMADFDGLIDIDGDSDDRVPQNIEKRSVENSNGEGDDEDYGSVMSDESGSSSGDEITTEVDITVVSPVSTATEEAIATTEETTTINNKITEDPEEPTEDKLPEEPTDGNEVGGGDMVGGGISETDAPDDNDSTNAEAQVDEIDKSAFSVLTTEVIAAVVVGAVCAVILIAFLVYRLRKRDEGSYLLSDVGYKDTYKLQGDTGKEAFV